MRHNSTGDLETDDPLASALAESGLWNPRFPAADAVEAAAGQFDQIPRWRGPSEPGQRWRITVSPGVLSIGTHDPTFAERTGERQLARHQADTDRAAAEINAEIDAFLAESEEHQLSMFRREPAARPRGRIREWSRKSRANMCKVFGQLDYLPMLTLGIFVTVTLTYPGDWLTVAPDGKAVKRHLEAFKERWRKEWGMPLALWKMEFQRRGAPHFHLLTALQTRRLSSDGLPFRDWVRVNWAAVVAHPDPEEFRRHLLAGTSVDEVEGLKCRDPRRVAVYFSKHGVYRSKEYQNQPPPEWADAGRTVGRFWGFWGLEKTVAAAEVTRDDACAGARVLRAWSERVVNYGLDGWPSTSGVRTQVRLVRRVSTRTGAISHRKVRRRVRRLKTGRGWVSVNNGPVFAWDLARFLCGPGGSEDWESRRVRLVAATGTTAREGEHHASSRFP